MMLSLILTLFTNPTLSKAQNHTKHMYAKTTVNIRSKPNTKSKVVGQVHWNDKVKVVSLKKKWAKILYKGKLRYICRKYIRNKKKKYKEYKSPSSNTFKSCLPVESLTNNTQIPQGRLKKKYRLDYKTGVYMVGDRYCVAVGSYYTRGIKNKIGTKIDVVLKHKKKTYVLKCILADQKSDKHTINNHRVHKDGSVLEFVINSNVMPHYARYVTGDVSYAGKQFKGKVMKIRVYKRK